MHAIGEVQGEEVIRISMHWKAIVTITKKRHDPSFRHKKLIAFMLAFIYHLRLKLQRHLLALDTANDLLRRVLGDNLVVVQHLELLSSVPAHEVHDSLGTTGVLV